MVVERVLEVLLILAAMGAGLIGGVFFAFSSFVMKALGNVGSDAGLRAMQRINIDVLNWHFLGLFFGSALPAVLAAILAIANWSAARSLWVVMGAALYTFGTVFVTAACNVPLNNRLATVDPEAPNAAETWQMYQSKWTWWNHFRTVAAVLATACLLIPLLGPY